MYKYIFCDLDGTLLDDQKNVSKENIEAIKKAQEKGTSFIICSGRAPYTIKEPLRKIEQYGNSNVYAICSNGACIVNGELEFLYSNPLPKDLILSLFNFGTKLEKAAMTLAFADKHLRYNLEQIPRNILNQWDWNTSDSKEEIIKDIKEKDCYKISFISQDFNYLSNVEKQLQELYQNIEISYSGCMYLEVNTKYTTKFEAIKKFISLFNGNIDECIAIGDYKNDYQMIENVGFSCCPNNATDEIKKIAKYICSGDNNHNAVAEVINKFILNKQ